MSNTLTTDQQRAARLRLALAEMMGNYTIKNTGTDAEIDNLRTTLMTLARDLAPADLAALVMAAKALQLDRDGAATFADAAARTERLTMGQGGAAPKSRGRRWGRR